MVEKKVSLVEKKYMQENEAADFETAAKPKPKQSERMVRISIYCPEALRREYKALLAKQGKTIQDDIIDHVRRTVANAKY